MDTVLKHSLKYGKKNFERNPDIALRNANDYYLPNPRVDSFKLLPIYSFPYEWNKLPDELKFQFNRCTFKIALKNFLLEPQ